MKRQSEGLLRWRKEFPILKKLTYLISNSLGAMPRSVYERMQEYAHTWSSRGVYAWEDSWWELSMTIGDIIAPLIGAKRGEISMHPNISLIQAILISCFEFGGKRNNVVYSDMEFPSVMYVYERFARSLRARLKIVRSKDGITIPTEKILNAIDDTTLLVPISHVFFKSGYIQDVKTIASKAHQCGAIVILDAYHSVGILPIDVRSLGVDILVGGVLKWLCGGPGGAFLWIRPSLRKRLKPKITGWFAHQRPFSFTMSMRYRKDAYRFMNGTPSIPSLYAVQEGPKIISRIGVEKIRTNSMRQTSLIIREASRHGFQIVSPLEAPWRGGAVTISVPHAYGVSRELIRRNIIVDYRDGAGIRIAPHFYNSDEEILSSIEEIKNILDTKAYKRYSARKKIVT